MKVTKKEVGGVTIVSAADSTGIQQDMGKQEKKVISPIAKKETESKQQNESMEAKTGQQSMPQPE